MNKLRTNNDSNFDSSVNQVSNLDIDSQSKLEMVSMNEMNNNL